MQRGQKARKQTKASAQMTNDELLAALVEALGAYQIPVKSGTLAALVEALRRCAWCEMAYTRGRCVGVRFDLNGALTHRQLYEFEAREKKGARIVNFKA